MHRNAILRFLRLKHVFKKHFKINYNFEIRKKMFFLEAPISFLKAYLFEKLYLSKSTECLGQLVQHKIQTKKKSDPKVNWFMSSTGSRKSLSILFPTHKRAPL